MKVIGYSGTPLPKKLGLKPGMSVLFLGLPDSLASLTEHASPVALATPNPTRGLDYIHIFETSRLALSEQLPALISALRADGMLWISWPKKASGVSTTITEDVLRELVLPTGLVDVKVCAVDAVWSGLKFMFRKELRAALR